MPERMPLRVLAINCTLKRAPQHSSTQKLLIEIMAAFKEAGADGDIILATDFNILPGVKHAEGPGDDWPQILEKIRASDILILGTPIWLGQPSSVVKRVCERMDAFLEDVDTRKRMLSYNKVAAVAVVGNEDGAHHVSAELYQALNDVGFSLAPCAVSYWVGEAMADKNYVDLDHAYRKTQQATQMMVLNAVHLATVLKNHPLPGKAT